MSKPWMSDDRFRQNWEAGLTLDEIGRLNLRLLGWKPTRSAVSDHAKSLGLPSRARGSRNDMVPWRLKAEHVNSRWRLMLEAESRCRQRGEENISATDRKARNLLHDYLHGRGADLVVSYDPVIGWHLVDARPGEDIIRKPETGNPGGGENTITAGINGAAVSLQAF